METQKGGVYRSGDGYVDANGKEVKLREKPKEETAPSTTRTAGAVSSGDVTYASPEAEQAAKDAGLTPEDFKGKKGSGSDGAFTKPDVAGLIEAKQAK